MCIVIFTVLFGCIMECFAVDMILNKNSASAEVADLARAV